MSRLNNPANLVLDIPFNSHTDDVSGNDTNFVVQGNETYDTNSNGKSYFDFDTSTRLFLTPNESRLKTNKITIHQKINFTSTATSYIYTNTSDKLAIIRYSTGAGKLNFLLNTTVGAAVNLQTTKALNDGLDHCLTCIYDGANMYIYIDGELDISSAKTGTITYSGEDSISIGASQSSASTYSFNGKIGEFKQFDIALTGDEVRDLCSVGVPEQVPVSKPIPQVPDLTENLIGSWLNNRVNCADDYTTNGNDGTVGNDTIICSGKAEFDGATDYIYLGNDAAFNESTNLTLRAKIKNVDVTKALQVIIDNDQSSSSSGRNWGMWLKSGKLSFRDKFTNHDSNTTLSNDKWYDIVITLNDKDVQFYVDGESDGSATLAASISPLSSGVYIGDWFPGEPSTNTGFNGTIKEVEIYNETKDANWAKFKHLETEPETVLPIKVPELESSLKGSWLNSESTLANDYSGNGNDGIQTDVEFGTGAQFNGSSSKIDIGQVVTGYPFMCSATVKFDSTAAANGAIIGFAGNDVNYHAIYLIPGTKEITLRTYDGTIRDIDYIVSDVFEKMHITGVWRSATDRELYVNGVSVGTSTTAENGNVGYSTTRLGLLPDTTPLYYFKGLLEDVRVYNESKSDAWIKSEYERTVNKHLVLDVLDGTKDLTKNNHAIINNGAIVGKEIELDGVNDYLNLGYLNPLDGLSNFTVSSWVKADAFQVTTDGVIAIVGEWQDWYAPESANAFLLGLSHNTGNPQFDVYTSAGKQRVTSSDTILIDTWYNVVGTYDGANVKIYVNGELKGSIYHSGAVGVSGTPLRIGEHNYSNFDGKIKDVKIYDSTKSADWIKNYYKKTRKFN